MYKDLDYYLKEFIGEDWYEVACQCAETILEKFSDEDWENLFDELHTKDSAWKIRLVYCIEPSMGLNGFNLLIRLVNDNDNEVVEYVLDSLRSFNTKEYHQKISGNLEIIEKAQDLLENTTSLPVQTVLKHFLKLYNDNA